MMGLNRLCSTVVRDDVINPAGILRSLQLNMVIGRVYFTHEEKIGETDFIMVDPQNLLLTVLDDISFLPRLSKNIGGPVL